MKLAVVADVHGNLPALQAVLDDLPADVEETVCLGDVVGYGPWPGKCLDLVRERCSTVVQGNHDREVRRPGDSGFNDQAVAALRYAKEELSESDLAWLEGLPRRTDYGEDLLLAHDHPETVDRYVTPRAFPEVRPYLDDYAACFLGHTHLQHEAVIDDRLILNPGSVGQPRDGDPRAAYAVVETGTWETGLHRVAYDVDRVQEAVAERGLPAEVGERLEAGR